MSCNFTMVEGKHGRSATRNFSIVILMRNWLREETDMHDKKINM